ncbi:uncharacterized protein LOC129173621 [Dunckerocampus dactyliophorus]|uniref:uncharacterized protein LOC129173621 n=1 Tax=Dunckerocampus dactyliophorus TaxID=161453 RepID=UPI00240612D2|nr:uncharacterized protein LOC129173621 [Dunckerocampus dactyliophorus]
MKASEKWTIYIHSSSKCDGGSFVRKKRVTQPNFTVSRTIRPCLHPLRQRHCMTDKMAVHAVVLWNKRAKMVEAVPEKGLWEAFWTLHTSHIATKGEIGGFSQQAITGHAPVKTSYSWRVTLGNYSPNTLEILDLLVKKLKVKHGGGGIMVWGCTSAAVPWELRFIEGNMYCDIVKQNMIPSPGLCEQSPRTGSAQNPLHLLLLHDEKYETHRDLRLVGETTK